jgi:hypothetical protein
MKHKWLFIALIVLIQFAVLTQSSGQGKLTLAPGIGLPDLINIGLKYEVAEQARLGFSAGWWPPSNGFLSWGHLVALNGDFYHHFGGSPDQSGLRPFFIRTGLNYVFDFEYGDSYFLTLYLRIGAEIRLSGNSGISIDAGPGYNTIHEKNGMSALIPVFGASYYYRF